MYKKMEASLTLAEVVALLRGEPTPTEFIKPSYAPVDIGRAKSVLDKLLAVKVISAPNGPRVGEVSYIGPVPTEVNEIAGDE